MGVETLYILFYLLFLPAAGYMASFLIWYTAVVSSAVGLGVGVVSKLVNFKYPGLFTGKHILYTEGVLYLAAMVCLEYCEHIFKSGPLTKDVVTVMCFTAFLICFSLSMLIGWLMVAMVGVLVRVLYYNRRPLKSTR